MDCYFGNELIGDNDNESCGCNGGRQYNLIYVGSLVTYGE